MAERYKPDTDLERRLRTALDAPPGTAERIARKALATPARPTPHRWPRLAASAAALVATALLVLVSVRAFDRRPGTGEEVGSPVVEARFAVTNRDGIVVVRSLDGGPSSLHAPGRHEPAPAGMMIIVLGETRP